MPRLMSLLLRLKYKAGESMCYYVKKYERAKIAKEDILAFKVYKNVGTLGGVLISPVVNMSVKSGEWLTRVKIVKKSILTIDDELLAKGRDMQITHGYHCYTREDDFFVLMKYYDAMTLSKYVVCEVVIPKGTRYYSNPNTMVAEQIIVGRRLRELPLKFSQPLQEANNLWSSNSITVKVPSDATGYAHKS